MAFSPKLAGCCGSLRFCATCLLPPKLNYPRPNPQYLRPPQLNYPRPDPQYLRPPQLNYPRPDPQCLRPPQGTLCVSSSAPIGWRSGRMRQLRRTH